jgi:DNA-binding transcriptional ArsR family regulator
VNRQKEVNMDSSNLSVEINQLHADLCSALGDPTRILILYALAETGITVGELASRVGVTQPTASRHLKLLRERGLVRASRQGTSVEYQLTDQRLIEALDLLRGVLRDRIQHRANLLDIP